MNFDTYSTNFNYICCCCDYDIMIGWAQQLCQRACLLIWFAEWIPAIYSANSECWALADVPGFILSEHVSNVTILFYGYLMVSPATFRPKDRVHDVLIGLSQRFVAGHATAAEDSWGIRGTKARIMSWQIIFRAQWTYGAEWCRLVSEFEKSKAWCGLWCFMWWQL